jgi:hypothetical protein
VDFELFIAPPNPIPLEIQHSFSVVAVDWEKPEKK